MSITVTELYSDEQGVSQFRDIAIDACYEHDLGFYTDAGAAASVRFWSFEPERFSDWHTAPQTQYVIILEGKIAITTDNGEERVFQAGDILLANNLSGKGHQSRTIAKGRGLIITQDACLYNDVIRGR